ncbi:Insulin-like growth factor binding protein, N-terminal [Pseudocohnilembus persalinus]|uniref:Insulin-like growth factor binding protein, N-terminal n=1 Tax=Pseudocohnilembus persalinus TaxID=266149 RepID=A0A0V0QEP0_PSEPJ|nr:Insulin-like growth factor binding protein, N-terminal [Pseudocohnilembus persalinus]|eukprot:KRX00637.1 Insulin-like growth factor binding protein, N-terminal [Pseudocohnilembus persalinus]
MDDKCQICDNQVCLKCKDPLKQPPECQNYIQNQVMVYDQEGNRISLRKNRQLGTNECQCAPGFYQPISELPDPQKKSDCQGIYDYDKCTICKSQEININPVNQKCECQPGYKLNYHQNKCIKCFQYKDQVCYENCPNGTVPNEESNICQDQIEKINQNSQYSLDLYIYDGEEENDSKVWINLLYVYSYDQGFMTYSQFYSSNLFYCDANDFCPPCNENQKSSECGQSLCSFCYQTFQNLEILGYLAFSLISFSLLLQLIDLIKQYKVGSTRGFFRVINKPFCMKILRNAWIHPLIMFTVIGTLLLYFGFVIFNDSRIMIFENGSFGLCYWSALISCPLYLLILILYKFSKQDLKQMELFNEFLYQVDNHQSKIEEDSGTENTQNSVTNSKISDENQIQTTDKDMIRNKQVSSTSSQYYVEFSSFNPRKQSNFFNNSQQGISNNDPINNFHTVNQDFDDTQFQSYTSENQDFRFAQNKDQNLQINQDNEIELAQYFK